MPASEQTSAAAPSVTPSITASPSPTVGSSDSVLTHYKKQLDEAGARGDCDAEVARVRAALKQDPRVTDQDLQQAIDQFEKVKGPMPYPSPATACAVFGFQKAARGAVADRAQK